MLWTLETRLSWRLPGQRDVPFQIQSDGHKGGVYVGGHRVLVSGLCFDSPVLTMWVLHSLGLSG